MSVVSRVVVAPSRQAVSSQPLTTARWLVGWALSRAVLVLLIRAMFEQNALTDIATYFDWSKAAWLHGLLPGRDFPSEYPPGAFPFILLPATDHGPFGFLRYFASLLMLFDAGLLALLLRQTRRSTDTTGLALWVWGPLFVGPLFLERFDLIPAVLSAAALSWLVKRPATAAAVLTVAAAVKVWPASLLPLLARRLDGWRAWLTAAVITASGIYVASALVGVQDAWRTTFSQQSGRGLQVEAVVATPYDWVRFFGGSHHAFRHGAWEVTVPTASAVGGLVWLLGLLGIGSLIVAVARRMTSTRPPDVAVAGTALTACVLVVDKALSPQYLVWLLALVCVAALHPFAGRRAVVVLVLAALGLTQVVYPLSYTPFLHGALGPLLALTARNVCLILLAALLVRATLTKTVVPSDVPLEEQ